MTVRTAKERTGQRAEALARKARAVDASLVASQLSVYGEIVDDKGIEAAARLCGYLIGDLGLCTEGL